MKKKKLGPYQRSSDKKLKRIHKDGVEVFRFGLGTAAVGQIASSVGRFDLNNSKALGESRKLGLSLRYGGRIGKVLGLGMALFGVNVGVKSSTEQKRRKKLKAKSLASRSSVGLRDPRKVKIKSKPAKRKMAAKKRPTKGMKTVYRARPRANGKGMTTRKYKVR